MTRSHTSDRTAWLRLHRHHPRPGRRGRPRRPARRPSPALLRWSTWPITGLPTSQQLRDLPTTVVSDAAATDHAHRRPLGGMGSIRAVRPGRGGGRSAGPGAAFGPGGAAPASRPGAGRRGRDDDRLARAPARRPGITAGRRLDRRTTARDHTARHDRSQADPPPTPPPPAVPAASESGLIEVVADDDPWTLAATHLGDGARWRELWDANRDRVQPDGQRWTIGHHIEPGWTLVLPSAPAAPTAPSPASPDVITVVEADTAWDLAAAHLGDPARWHELFDANQNRPQADGGVWTDPDVLRVGWQLTIPGRGAGAGRRRPAPARHRRLPARRRPRPNRIRRRCVAEQHRGNRCPAIDPAGPGSPTEREEPSDSDEPAISEPPSDASEQTEPTADTRSARPRRPARRPRRVVVTDPAEP